jgi:hypothetical protein
MGVLVGAVRGVDVVGGVDVMGVVGLVVVIVELRRIEGMN